MATADCETAVVALGANLPSRAGPPALTLSAALTLLPDAGMRPVKLSSFWRSAAWPRAEDPPFINAVALCETALPPQAVLAALLEIERRFGRVRGLRNAPRPLDLDLIDYAGRIVSDEGLTLPHPRLGDRGFVLGPLSEVAPDWRHPATGETVETLFVRADQTGLKRLGPPPRLGDLPGLSGARNP